MAELERLGLIRSEIAVVAADGWSTDRRPRKVIYLNHNYLLENDGPTKPV